MQIVNNLLEDNTNQNLKHVSSPNHGDKFATGLPDTIIIHYTAGFNAESSIRTLCDDKAVNRASAHLVIGRDSTITQLVPFNIVAWHAGKSQYQGRVGFNQYAIGIEIDNAGELTKVGEKFVSWFGKEYAADDVANLKHRNQQTLKYWHTYKEEQIQIVFEICHLLAQAYPIRSILGHEEISPTRKTDPGPAFPLDKLRDTIFNQQDADDAEDADNNGHAQGVVNTGALNLRKAPVGGEVITRLPKETKVNILAEKDGWYQVATGVGWVKKEFIKIV